MLPVTLFIAFWVVVALIVFFVAGSGGPSGAARASTGGARRSSRGFGLLLIVIFVGFGVALPLVFLHGNDANANKQVGGIKLTSAERTGREIFAFRCGFCHTLAAANTVGKVGPDLDQIQPSAQLVLNTINNGCLQSPPAGSDEGCLGQGNMPAGIIQGRQAEEVAAFVSRVAGHE